MNEFKFKLNQAGVRELMRSPAMQSILTGKASAIQSRCGSGYKQDIYVGTNRANAMVYAATKKAKIENKKNNTLLKAVH